MSMSVYVVARRPSARAPRYATFLPTNRFRGTFLQFPAENGTQTFHSWSRAAEKHFHEPEPDHEQRERNHVLFHDDASSATMCTRWTKTLTFSVPSK
jgi:hypothetical protein